MKLLICLALVVSCACCLAQADKKMYLSDFAKQCAVDWPANHRMTVVCHGHSVPAGYFKTPAVQSLDAYPHLLRVGLSPRFPKAVINVIVTAIGGENSEQGAKRFAEDVLVLKPDVVTIDYGLNDRGIGLPRAKTAWTTMIKAAQEKGAKVILLTPTGDLSSKMDDPQDPLNQHAEQIRALAKEFGVGLVDSLVLFKEYTSKGGHLEEIMSQVNHPNRKGHELVSTELLTWFHD